MISTFASATRGIVISDDILTLESLPRTLAVVGAGVIGIEYATIFAALGVRVTVIDKRLGREQSRDKSWRFLFFLNVAFHALIALVFVVTLLAVALHSKASPWALSLSGR